MQMHSRTHGMREHPLRPWRVTFPVATGGFCLHSVINEEKLRKKSTKVAKDVASQCHLFGFASGVSRPPLSNTKRRSNINKSGKDERRSVKKALGSKNASRAPKIIGKWRERSERSVGRKWPGHSTYDFSYAPTLSPLQ